MKVKNECAVDAGKQTSVLMIHVVSFGGVVVCLVSWICSGSLKVGVQNINHEHSIFTPTVCFNGRYLGLCSFIFLLAGCIAF